MAKYDRLVSTEKETKIRIRELAPAVPAFLLCFVILVMLVLDVAVPEMSERQYMLFPLFIRLVSMISVLCAAFCFTDRLFSDQIRIDAGVVCFSMFIICMIISTCINGFSRDALLGVQYRYLGVIDFSILILGYMYCSRSMVKDTLRHAIFMSYLFIADIVATVFITDWYMHYADAFRDKNEPAAIFFHGNHYGYFIVMAVMVAAGYCLYGKNKKQTILGTVSLALQLYVLAANRSVGCLIAAAAALVIAVLWAAARGFLSKRNLIIIAVIVFAMTAVILIFASALRDDVQLVIKEIVRLISGTDDEYAGHGRWKLWKETVALIADRPVTGYGCEGIRDILGDRVGITSPHCEVMTYATFFGIPAALLYAAGVIVYLIRGLNSHERTCRIAACAALGYFLSSMFGVAMFYTAPFFFVFLGSAFTGTEQKMYRKNK